MVLYVLENYHNFKYCQCTLNPTTYEKMRKFLRTCDIPQARRSRWWPKIYIWVCFFFCTVVSSQNISGRHIFQVRGKSHRLAHQTPISNPLPLFLSILSLQTSSNLGVTQLWSVRHEYVIAGQLFPLFHSPFL